MSRSDPDPAAGARISLFVGKGGVGKSTLATATAVRDARAGLRVLIVSTDQAHSTGDVLGTTVTPTGTREPTRVLADLDADAGRRLPRRAGPRHAGAAGGPVARGRRRAGRPVPRVRSGRHCARRTFGAAGDSGGARPARGGRARRLRAVGPRRRRLRVDRRRDADAHPARDLRPVPGAGLAAAPPAVAGGRGRPRRRPWSTLLERIGAGTERLGSLLTDGSTGQRAPGADPRAGGRRRGGPHAGLAGADGRAGRRADRQSDSGAG